MRALTVVAVIIAFAAALAAGRALGQTDGESSLHGRGRDFKLLDRNGDGMISRVEALANREIHKRFGEFDADKDGLLTEQEYVLAMEDNEKRVLQDAAITARVKAALLAERGIPSLAISVDTYEGRVHLKGFVGAPELASKAGRVTASVSGVRTVDNRIAVGR
jgi:osmotically-inducible protein OsmY